MSFKIAKLDVPEKDFVKVMYIAGEIDESNLNEFKAEFEPLLQAPEVNVYIFHLRDLEFLNSMGIGYLAGVYSELRGQGKKMILAELNEHINDILTLVGFTNLTENYETLREAIDAASA